MLYFANDYSEGAHPAILQKLIETNTESLDTYGFDKYTMSAKEKIRAACECPEADVYFLGGGTQTNKVTIDALLKPYEGVVSAVTGHVNGHEAGAIEASNHKVLTVPQTDGKITAEVLEDYMETFYGDASHEHMVFPGMVYISHPTEYGTLYSLEELKAVSEVAHKYNMPLYLDGARLGYALATPGTDVTLPDIAKYCDVFYIGGTKVGALCGEALVFTKNNCPAHFLAFIKRNGALFAKGRLPGIQFDVLFTDDLYVKISENAIRCADRLRGILKSKGYQMFLETPANQIFVVMDNEKIKELSEKVVFSFWEKYDDSHTVIRFATCWATTDEALDELEKLL